MSSPAQGHQPGSSAGPRSAVSGDLSTDPGRAQTYESLFRGGEDPVGPYRFQARYTSPAVTAPEQPAEPEDLYGWLYRPREPVGELSGSAPEAVPAVESSARDERAVDQPATMSAAVPDLVPGADRQLDPPVVADAKPRRRRRGPVTLTIVLLVLGVVGSASLLHSGMLAQATSAQGTFGATAPTTDGPTAAGPTSAGPAPSSSGPSSSGPSAPASSAQPTPGRPATTSPATPKPATSTATVDRSNYAGAVQPLAVAGVTASCQAPPTKDDSGRTVRYDAELAVDGNSSTAWRCAGSSRGRSVELRFAKGTKIAEVGLVNGYTKVDSKSGNDRYGEYRRIRQVRWDFGHGRTLVQDLQDRVESVQTMRIPVQSTDKVTLTITQSTAPGGSAATRDAVLLSEVTFASPRS